MATSMNITHIKLGICSVKENALNEKTLYCTMYHGCFYENLRKEAPFAT